MVIQLVLPAIFWLLQPAYSTEPIDLDKAIQTDVIRAEFNGNEESTHYLKPLLIDLENLKNKKVVIRIISGYRFESNDSNVQDIITTAEELIALNPHEKRQIPVSGMCIQHYNAAPESTDSFKLSKRISPIQKRFAGVVDSAGWQNVQAQQAMWIISDGGDLYDLISYGDEAEWEMVNLVAGLMDQPVPSRENFNQEVTQRTQRSATLKGVFKFKFSRPAPIHIALFDENGIVLKEIYRESAKPGRHEVTYEFDALPYEGQTIYACFIAFDDVLMERVINL
jgi:hypothetical protein